MVGGAHRQRDVTDRGIDLVLSTWAGFVGEDLHAVAFVGDEPAVAIVGDEPAETLAFVQEPELRPHIHQPIRGWRAGQTYDPRDPWADGGEGFEALRPMILEAGEFVDDDHVERPRASELFDQPGDVLPVDDGHHRIPCKRV